MNKISEKEIIDKLESRSTYRCFDDKQKWYYIMGAKDTINIINESLKESCQTCKFYDRGECRRRPPIGRSWHVDHERAKFRGVSYDDWCGEYRRKE